MNKASLSIVPWKSYLSTTLETVVAFYTATLSLALFMTHHGPDWIPTAIIMVLLYISVIAMCIIRVIQKFSMAALMIIIPIAPLFALFGVVSLIPVLEKLG